MTAGELATLGIAAAANDWTLGAIVEDERDDVTGYAAVERSGPPFGDRTWATARWEIGEEKADFSSGNYDLTREEALTDLFDRARGGGRG